MSILHLKKSMFGEKEALLVNHEGIHVLAFRYPSGICALRVSGPKGELILLPFDGQQIWRADMLGHALTMRSMFEEPTGSNVFLKTYGGFMLHCGLSGIGAPGVDDTHAQHGELPNAPYNSAVLHMDSDEHGAYVALSGVYQHRIGFTAGYDFKPECCFYENLPRITQSVNIVNVRGKPLPYLYLCHINFIPVDGAKLISSAMNAPGEYTVHTAEAPETHRIYAESLRKDFNVQDIIGSTGQCYDPEICITLRYRPDERGIGHTMQRLPDGYAHYVSHPVDALPVPVRWISRNNDEDAMGMVLPATAEHLGFTNALKKGQVRFLPPYETAHFSMEIGVLTPEEAQCMEMHIQTVMESTGIH